MSAVVIFGYIVPLLVLKIRFGFDDDDIPIGYGFDLLLISAAAFVVGVAAAVFLSRWLYRQLTPAIQGRVAGSGR
jgi:hypothetical protein